MTGLNEFQQMRLDTELRGKRGAALKAAGIRFHMYYRPPLMRSVRRVLAMVGGLVIIANFLRALVGGQMDTFYDWLILIPSLFILVLCGLVFRSGAALIWIEGEPRMHRSQSGSLGQPVAISFESDEPTIVAVGGVRCRAAAVDIDVLAALEAERMATR